MSYRGAIPDIPPGSTWIDCAGARSTVRSSVIDPARYVCFTRENGARPLRLETVHENDFRREWSAIYDRAAIRSQFTMSLANLGEFRVFWLPEHRRIMARSVSCTRHFKVPPGALLVGVYSTPCKTDAFFDDLDELLRTAADPIAIADRVRA